MGKDIAKQKEWSISVHVKKKGKRNVVRKCSNKNNKIQKVLKATESILRVVEQVSRRYKDKQAQNQRNYGFTRIVVYDVKTKRNKQLV